MQPDKEKIAKTYGLTQMTHSGLIATAVEYQLPEQAKIRWNHSIYMTKTFSILKGKREFRRI